MKVGDIFSLINLVSGGIGYGLLPGRVSAFSARVRLIPLALAAECRMYGRSDKGG